MNINYVLKNIKNPDVKIRKINNLVYIIFIESICNTSVINDFIVKPIIKYKINNMKDLNNNIYNSQKIKIYDYKKFYKLLYSGFCIICINNKFIGFETKGTLDSGILVSTNEKSIKGPKDAFTENYQINIGLIRKRIKSNNLVIKEMTIGKDSITNISMIYMKNICNKNFVKKIEKKLNLINIDYVANSNYISELLDKNNNIFPTTLS